MSVANVYSFYALVEEDEALQARLKEVEKEAAGSKEAAVEQVLVISKELGLEFSLQDLQDVQQASVTSADGEAEVVEMRKCQGLVAWKDNPPEEGCLIVYGCGYQHPRFFHPRPPE